MYPHKSPNPASQLHDLRLSREQLALRSLCFAVPQTRIRDMRQTTLGASQNPYKHLDTVEPGGGGPWGFLNLFLYAGGVCHVGSDPSSDWCLTRVMNCLGTFQVEMFLCSRGFRRMFEASFFPPPADPVQAISCAGSWCER